jgi:hypothetical protein
MLPSMPVIRVRMIVLSEGVRSDEARTTANSLSTVLNHGADSANGITSYISSSGDAAGQHAHGSILYVIRDEARHSFDVSIIRLFNSRRHRREVKDDEALGRSKIQG